MGDSACFYNKVCKWVYSVGWVLCLSRDEDDGRPLRRRQLAHDAGEFNVWIAVSRTTVLDCSQPWSCLFACEMRVSMLSNPLVSRT